MGRFRRSRCVIFVDNRSLSLFLPFGGFEDSKLKMLANYQMGAQMEGWNDCPVVPEVMTGVRKVSGKKKRPQRVGHDFGLATPTPTGTPTGTPTLTPDSSFRSTGFTSRNITPISLATLVPPPPKSVVASQPLSEKLPPLEQPVAANTR